MIWTTKHLNFLSSSQSIDYIKAFFLLDFSELKQKTMIRIVFFLIIIIGASCTSKEYVELKPIILSGDKLVETEPAGNFYSNVKHVLDFYNVPYKVDEHGVVLITRELSADRDLLRNYTNKANDPEWMEMNGQ